MAQLPQVPNLDFDPTKPASVELDPFDTVFPPEPKPAAQVVTPRPAIPVAPHVAPSVAPSLAPQVMAPLVTPPGGGAEQAQAAAHVQAVAQVQAVLSDSVEEVLEQTSHQAVKLARLEERLQQVNKGLEDSREEMQAGIVELRSLMTQVGALAQQAQAGATKTQGAVESALVHRLDGVEEASHRVASRQSLVMTLVLVQLLVGLGLGVMLYLGRGDLNRLWEQSLRQPAPSVAAKPAGPPTSPMLPGMMPAAAPAAETTGAESATAPVVEEKKAKTKVSKRQRRAVGGEP